ncbi:MAG: hypothetical protein CML55_01355 [Rhodobacteraceae bacterium]|nr:hypothetical protein [Paracoccaceae bacterium]MBO28567.1 hypothetical protein [Paracoccaceae bacterium]|tara:strand:+ start:166 stop:444 length:279 start_codon:yes stop_codon:yes gene_type:complete
MTQKTTYQPGDFFPEDVLRFVDQHGEKWPAKVSATLDAWVDGETLVLDVHSGAEDAAVTLDIDGAENLPLRPAPNAGFTSTAAAASQSASHS